MATASTDVSSNRAYQSWLGHHHSVISLITGRFLIAALAFGFIEHLLNSPQPDVAATFAISTLESTVPNLEEAGFQKLVFEDFYEVVLSLIQQIIVPEPGGTTLTSETLLEAFQSPEGKVHSLVKRVDRA